ncbi:unnamed protein product [Clonostachys rosea]|uniref:Acetoacetate decarboxylase n=1 Tax=Bionectria ochroleuca TaxID=29856 RepID=A0ABY6U222_BIOOC|nr:unnamed protein product [Clonostachys rosea]
MVQTDLLRQLYKRIPITFGPFPGPRQSFAGRRWDGSNSSSVEAYITFKASQNTVKRLLPDVFTFQEPTRDAFVTLAPKELFNLEWLGGRGYRLYSLYIHGVKYEAADGTTYNGTYIPVLWEDLADPIISGREELGYPKLFADLHITRTETSYAARASWKGTEFSAFQLNSLREIREDIPWRLAPNDAGIDDAVGQPGTADAEYPVFIPAAEEADRQAVTLLRRFSAPPEQSKLSWHQRDSRFLPTLHHIVQQIGHIRPLEIVAAGVVEKRGIGDLSSARRIDK